MRKYGYLGGVASDSEALYGSDAIKRALRRVQMYGGIQKTGELDETTLKVR